jgi:hypothetical protein
MTQYDRVVDRQRRLLAAEKWAKTVYQLYAHDGVIETQYFNGDVHYEQTENHPEGPKKYWVRGNMTEDELLSKFGRHVADENAYIQREWYK